MFPTDNSRPGVTFSYEVKDLTKVYTSSKVAANRDIGLDIRSGEVFGIFGTNGAGKTTLVRQMAGLLRPTSGAIRLLGHDVVADPSVVPHFVSYYDQKVMALRAHKVHEVILHTAIFRGLSVAQARSATHDLLDRFGLGSVADRPMFKLSGWQQRQTALLASLVGDRPVLILDEPTNELDPTKRRQVWDYLWELNQQRGTTIILVTHNVMEAEQVVERVAIIDQGRVVALGTPGELKAAVDGSVRVEVRLRPTSAAASALPGDGRAAAGASAADAFARFPGAVRLREGQYRITAPREQAQQLFRAVLDRVGLDRLDDFRLVTPSLEDVYIHFTAKERSEPA